MFYQLLTFLDAFSGLPVHHELVAQVSRVCSERGVIHQRIPFGHPQSIGRVELFHRRLREEEASLCRYSNPEEARQRIGIAVDRYSTQRYHQGIGDVKPIDRHEGWQNEIIARREEVFNSIKRDGRKPKILAPV